MTKQAGRLSALAFFLCTTVSGFSSEAGLLLRLLPAPSADGSVLVENLQTDGAAVAVDDEMTETDPEWARVLAPGRTHQQISVSADRERITLTISGMEGMRIVIPPGGAAEIEPAFAFKKVSIRPGTLLPTPIEVLWEDGAVLQADSSSFAQIEFFNDASYVVFGEGALSGQTRYGEIVSPVGGVFSLEGGEKEELAGPGANRFALKVPARTIRLGRDGQAITISAAEPEQVWRLEPDDQELLRFPNGSALIIERSPDRASLGLMVMKGDFRIGIAGISGWELRAVSGCSFELQWDPETRVVDVKNTTPDLSLVVQLPHRMQATLAPGAFFQYADMEAGLFATAASGAPVILATPGGGRSVRLDEGSFTFHNGAIFSESSGSAEEVQIFWRKGSGLSFQMNQEIKTVLPNSKEAIQNGNSDLIIERTDENSMTVSAIGAAFALELPEFQNLKFALRAGDVLVFQLNRADGVLDIRSGAEISRNLSFAMGAGIQSNLALNDGLRLHFRPDGTVFATQNGATRFFEPAGSEPPPSAADSVLSVSQAADVSRISQPPVSVFR